MGAQWEILLAPEVDDWHSRLRLVDPETVDRIEEAFALLRREGPNLRRPFADRVRGSTFHNMKELRPASTGSSEIRLLFAFDPVRRAVFVVAGDKAGDWNDWYRRAVPLADARYARHLRTLRERT